MNIKRKKETAQEVPVQEQYLVTISFDDKSLTEKLNNIKIMANNLNKEIASLDSTIKTIYQNY